jgi:hypothetical protein
MRLEQLITKNDERFTRLSRTIKISNTLMNWTRLLSSPRAAVYRRVLSCLLVGMIAYGTTVAAGHSHGYVPPNRSGTATLSDPGGSTSSDARHSYETECSICQFHQQLFKHLVYTSLLSPTPSVQLSSACVAPVSYSSISTTARRGRAPPCISLQ